MLMHVPCISKLDIILKSPGLWNQYDSDIILNKEDQLFKCIGILMPWAGTLTTKIFIENNPI